jgi:Swi5-dependent recombination DNA repair protein 1
MQLQRHNSNAPRATYIENVQLITTLTRAALTSNLLTNMSTPAAKRRRLENATNTLSKPFRSPFKTPLKNAGASHLKPDAGNADVRTGSSSRRFDNESAPQSDAQHGLPTPDTALSSSPYRSSPAKTPSTSMNKKTLGTRQFVAPLSTQKVNADPVIVALVKQQRQLEAELRAAKEELDMVMQARTIEASSERAAAKAAVDETIEAKDVEIDAELKQLISKWRGAARAAAEEMFGGVKDRVNRSVLPCCARLLSIFFPVARYRMCISGIMLILSV